MAKPTLGDIAAACPDPLLSDNYSLDIPNVPTGAASRPLLMLCRTASKPGMTLNAVEVQLFGHTLEHVGNLTYSHEMQVEYVENRMLQIHGIIEGWMEYCRSHDTQHGHYKLEYARDGYLKIFDQKGITVKEYRIEGMWPTTMPDTPFDGQAANIISVGVGFKYDAYRTR